MVYNNGDILFDKYFGAVRFIEDIGDGFYDCIRLLNGNRCTIKAGEYEIICRNDKSDQKNHLKDIMKSDSDMDLY